MKLHKLMKEISETYFAEKDNVWFKWKIFWTFVFITFLSLYLLQIYANYIDSAAIVDSDWINADEFWTSRTEALKIETVVLFGIFIRFFSSFFRGKWAVRFGEVGTLLAFSAFLRHWLWTREILSQFDVCSSVGLIGMTPLAGQLIGMFFFSLFFYKISFLIAVTWKTIRK